MSIKQAGHTVINIFYKMSKKKKSKDKSRVTNETSVQVSVTGISGQSQEKSYSLKQIVKKLSLKKKDDIKMLGHLIDEFWKTERIQELKNGSYKSNQHARGDNGHCRSREFTICLCKNRKDQPDIFIKGRDLGSAVDGDTVQIVIFPTRHGEHREGKVTASRKSKPKSLCWESGAIKEFCICGP